MYNEFKKYPYRIGNFMDIINILRKTYKVDTYGFERQCTHNVPTEMY